MGEVRRHLHLHGVNYTVWIGDVQEEIRREQEQNGRNGGRSKRESLWEVLVGAVTGERSGRSVGGGEGGRLDWGRYHRLNTIHHWMEELAARYPHLVTTKVNSVPPKYCLKTKGFPNRQKCHKIISCDGGGFFR